MVKKRILFVFFGILFLAACAGIFVLNQKPDRLSFESNISFLKKDPPQMTMLFVGDVMLSRSVEIVTRKYGNSDWNFPFALIKEKTQQADIAFANLENPVSTRGVKSGSIYSFRAHPDSLVGLKNAGFDVVSLANNHIWDYGRQAFLDTMTHLASTSIAHVGVGQTYDDAHRPYVATVNGTKVALLGYSEFASPYFSSTTSVPAIAGLNSDEIAADIARVKAQHNPHCVIVTIHWGIEYTERHNTKQEAIAKRAIDDGACLVIGHHTHSVQGVEKYKDGHIAYSLGNFVFDQNFSPETSKGLMLSVVFEKGRITSVSPIEVRFSQYYQPYIATSSPGAVQGLPR